MQLLDSEQLEYAFDVHGISREGEARRFYADLWNIIQAAEKIHDTSALAKTEASLRRLCRDYFSVMREWQHQEEEHYESAICCTSARDNAREAKAFLPAFEKQFIRYALCYLELNRMLIQVRGSLAHFARDYDADVLSKSLIINHATGALLQRAHRERKIIMEKRLRLDRVRGLLQHFDPLMELLGADLPRLLGQEAGDHQLTLFKGALRKSEFDRARAIVSAWNSDWLKQTGRTITDMAEKSADELRAQDGLMLHSGELTLIAMFLKSDEKKINQFLTKYNVPYMVYKYQHLMHQGYLLGRIGSIEGLIIQHAKMLSLSARLHNDMELAKAQEHAVLVPMRALMQDKFKSLTAIFDEMETTLSILEKLFSQTRDYLTHTPENLQN